MRRGGRVGEGGYGDEDWGLICCVYIQVKTGICSWKLEGRRARWRETGRAVEGEYVWQS